jgi:transposase
MLRSIGWPRVLKAADLFDQQAYKGRNVIERCINRLKDFRAVATRYDKRGRNYLAGVLVASIILWL